MGWLHRNLTWVLLTLVVVVTIALLGLVGVGALVLFAGVLGGATLATILADAAALLGLGTVLLVADVALSVALVVTVVRRVSLPRSDSLVRFFTMIERFVPPMRSLELARRFEPTAEDRERALKRRYVDGEITEVTFEREMADLLDDAESRAVVSEQVEAHELERE